MDLREQEYVVALARHQSITRAAEELFISQPTLSIFLNRLEERMGVPLFDRVGKRLVPTSAGELYVRSAREMLAIQNEFRGELSDMIKGYAGQLRLGLHLRRSRYLLPKVLTEFQRSHPQVEVTVTETGSRDMEQKLLDGDLDLILTNRFFQRDKLEILPVYNDHLVMALPWDHPACACARELPGRAYPWLDLKLLADERFILQSPEQSVRIFTDAAFHYAGITPKRSFVIENMETAVQMAAEGYGAAFNYESYVKYFQYEKPARFFLVGFADFTVPIALACRKGGYLPEFTHAFIRLVQTHFNEKKD